MTASKHDTRIYDALSGMREALTEEEAQMLERKERYDESKERVARLRRAIEALDPQPRAGNGNGGNGKSAKNTSRWTPGEDVRAKVLGGMRGKGKLTVNEIADLAGVSAETVRRTMEWGRSQVEPPVRFSGVTMNNAKTYESLEADA